MDDTTAKEFILALGILGDLSRDVTFADNGAATNQKSLFVCFYDHPTQWILASRFHDNEDEKENGFAVFGWPRNKFPRTVAAEFLSEMNLQIVKYRVEKFGEEQPPLS